MREPFCLRSGPSWEARYSRLKGEKTEGDVLQGLCRQHGCNAEDTLLGSAAREAPVSRALPSGGMSQGPLRARPRLLRSLQSRRRSRDKLM